MSDIFSFRLSDEFVNKYVGIEPPFGFKDAGLNSLGEINFIRTYKRIQTTVMYKLTIVHNIISTGQ